MSTLSNPRQHCIGNPNAVKTRKGNKKYTIRKEEIKLSLFTENMIAYVENPKESTTEEN